MSSALRETRVLHLVYFCLYRANRLCLNMHVCGGYSCIATACDESINISRTDLQLSRPRPSLIMISENYHIRIIADPECCLFNHMILKSKLSIPIVTLFINHISLFVNSQIKHLNQRLKTSALMYACYEVLLCVDIRFIILYENITTFYYRHTTNAKLLVILYIFEREEPL